MNLEICKKCCGKINFWDVEITARNETYLKIYYEDDSLPFGDSYCKKLISENSTKDFTKTGFDSFELNSKVCPYYVEHQMYDWNNKK